jgi:hypothetical protein
VWRAARDTTLLIRADTGARRGIHARALADAAHVTAAANRVAGLGLEYLDIRLAGRVFGEWLDASSFSPHGLPSISDKDVALALRERLDHAALAFSGHSQKP